MGTVDIAIIGSACLFPQAHNPQQLWENCIQNKDCLSNASADQWRVSLDEIIRDENNDEGVLWNNRVGLVTGFSDIFDSKGFNASSELILQFDAIFQWLLHVGREALQSAGLSINDMKSIRAGLISGNLSYPTDSLGQFAELVWLQSSSQLRNKLNININPLNSFMSGYPAQFVSQALNLSAGGYTLDAACGTAIYAIDLACKQLASGQVDLMLSGAINAADLFFVSAGFSALNAQSKTGQSTPFQQNADGLVPSQGCGLVVLKRLSDAVKDNNTILGVIRGIGLSNDGAYSGLLTPAQPGQVSAMKNAYSKSSITPDTIDFIDCHATSTALGDGIEINSIKAIHGAQALTLGALKANIGHSLAASTAASLCRSLKALEHHTLPPTRHHDKLLDVLTESPYQLLSEPKPWEASRSPLRAAINGFGMGGCNAHMIIENYEKPLTIQALNNRAQKPTMAITKIAIQAASCENTQDYFQYYLQQKSALSMNSNGKLEGKIDSIALPLRGMRYPPNDLKHAQAQQLALLNLSYPLLIDTGIEPEKISILAGMQCDPDLARFGLPWHLKSILEQNNIDEIPWLNHVMTDIIPNLDSADILGAMPNIVANRMNFQYHCCGPSFTVSAEEDSGLQALQIGIEQLQLGEVDMAVVCAVDFCCNRVHQYAIEQQYPQRYPIPGDAAILMLVKRLDDALASHDDIIAIIDNVQQPSYPVSNFDYQTIQPYFGHAHCASGLLQLATASLCVDYTHDTKRKNKVPTWMAERATHGMSVSVKSNANPDNIFYIYHHDGI